MTSGGFPSLIIQLITKINKSTQKRKPVNGKSDLSVLYKDRWFQYSTFPDASTQATDHGPAPGSYLSFFSVLIVPLSLRCLNAANLTLTSPFSFRSGKHSTSSRSARSSPATTRRDLFSRVAKYPASAPAPIAYSSVAMTDTCASSAPAGRSSEASMHTTPAASPTCDKSKAPVCSSPYRYALSGRCL